MQKTQIHPIEVSQATVEQKKELYKKVYGGSKKALVTVRLAPQYIANQVTAYENAEEEYNANVASYNALALAMNEGFDNIPSVRFDFFGVAYQMALAYGCPLVKNGGLIAAKPLYQSIDEVQPQNLKPERIHERGLYPIIIERIREFQQRYPQIPIAVSDNQSPIDVLTCILDAEEAMVGMYFDKEKIHFLLDDITQSILEINRHLEQTIQNFSCFRNNNGYIPRGIHLSDDNAAFISPDLYQEFAIPYSARLGEEFGGVNFHCCMGYEHNLQNIASTKGFMGFDPQRGHNDLDMILKALENGGVWELNNYPWQHQNYTEDQTWQLVWEALERAEGKMGLVVRLHSNKGNEEALRLGWEVKNRLAKAGLLQE